ncbi:MAG: GNAT family N-acetyltransferase [Xanthobacteraceae bacterium]|nr:GNAT family N-acetyltransferase [Xanthobacteraceae bacterium]
MLNRTMLSFREDDLSGAEVRALVARHLQGMAEHSPPGACFAFDADQLKQPGVKFWTAWDRETLAGMAALKTLDCENGEIKSMRVDDRFLGMGFGRALLEHVIAQAEATGIAMLWLETGSSPGFVPALKLYERAGFRYCGPFADYTENPFSRFMTREVAG